MLNVEDGGAAGGHRCAALDCRCAGKSDGAKVGKRHQLARVAALFKVLDNPLGIILAKRAVRDAGERLGDRLASSDILNHGRA